MELIQAITYLTNLLGFKFTLVNIAGVPFYVVTKRDKSHFGTLDVRAVRNLAMYTKELERNMNNAASTDAAIHSTFHAKPCATVSAV